MTDDPRREEGIRARGEEALSDLAQALLDNPIFGQAVSTAIGAGERAAHAQRSAMGALNIPAATDFERLEQRLRSLSDEARGGRGPTRRRARRACRAASAGRGAGAQDTPTTRPAPWNAQRRSGRGGAVPRTARARRRPTRSERDRPHPLGGGEAGARRYRRDQRERATQLLDEVASWGATRARSSRGAGRARGELTRRGQDAGAELARRGQGAAEELASGWRRSSAGSRSSEDALREPARETKPKAEG